jgi:hypothetical protein
MGAQYGGFAKRILAASYLSQLKGGGSGWITLILQPNFWTDDALRREVDEEMKRSIEYYAWTSGFLSILNKGDTILGVASDFAMSKTLQALAKFGSPEDIIKEVYVDFFSRPGVLTRELLGSIQKGNRSYKIDELLFASTIVIRPKNDFEVHVDDGTENRGHVTKIIESEYLKALELVEKMSSSTK